MEEHASRHNNISFWGILSDLYRVGRESLLWVFVNESAIELLGLLTLQESLMRLCFLLCTEDFDKDYFPMTLSACPDLMGLLYFSRTAAVYMDVMKKNELCSKSKRPESIGIRPLRSGRDSNPRPPA